MNKRIKHIRIEAANNYEFGFKLGKALSKNIQNFKMKFREITLKDGALLILGRNAESNDNLMRKFKGKSNIILHTVSPGSPFGVINTLKPIKEEIYASGVIVAKFSQDWRNNKKDIKVSVFTGKEISKNKDLKIGTWNVKKSKTITVKKEDILKFGEFLNKNDTK